jgi:peptide deformylase
MALRDIRILGDEVLRKKCKPISKVDDKIRMYLQDLADTLLATDNGAGLAAPQIGVLRRLVVVNLPEQGIVKLVNPEIAYKEGEQEVVEGCLSVPGKWGKLKRPFKVKVTALDENGEPLELEGEEHLAKLFCHEIDHLDGVLFVDKVTEYLEDEE